jgi:hypothetical protein
MSDMWIELAKRITASERAYRNLAEQDWRDGDVIRAVRYRGMAEGLAMACEHQRNLAAESRGEQ